MTKPLSERLEAQAVSYINSGHNQTISLLREAAELARRYEVAATVEITACNQIEGASDFDYGDMLAAVLRFKPGQQVRVVAEGEEK